MSGTLNFKNLPKSNQIQGGIEPGRHTLVIIKGVKEISAQKKQMLVLTHIVKGHAKPEIVDRYPLFNEDGSLANYGPYKLNCLMETTGVTPESDFTIETVGKMLEGKEYSAVLLEEEWQEKKYLKVGFPEDFQKVEESQAPQTETPQKEEPVVDPAVEAAIEEDQDI